MKDPKVNGTKVVFGPCRLSYTHLFSKYVGEGQEDGKYQTAILIPKSETKTLEALKQALNAAIEQGIQGKWGGKKPAKLENPMRDGDEKDDEVYAGHFYFNAKSSTRPGIVDKFGNPITDEEEIYSGVWCYCSVNFFPYKASGNCGVSAGLNNVMKFKDDDHLGGRVSAAADFEGFGEEVSGDDFFG